MSDKYKDVFPLIVGALAGLLIYLSTKKAPGARESNVTVNESVSIRTDASLVIGAPSDVVVSDGINILTDADLSVTAPSPPPPGEINVVVNDGVNVSTNANLSVA